MTQAATHAEPLGATVEGTATAFRVASGVAERVELVLFDRHGTEGDRVELTADDDGTWATSVAGVGDGQRYGFRVHGPGDPDAGHACDPAKLLVDPAARRVTGELRWCPELVAPGVDSTPLVPRSVVVSPPEPVPRTERPGTPWDRTVIYEAHVGHLTACHPMVPVEHRGRYPGLGAPAVVDHLQRLGVTAVELLPVQHFVSERDLVARHQRNVWGYNPLAWGAPHAGYATSGGDPVSELRAAVAALHAAGIEVLLDVVFNHTCEGSLGRGPILSWRGFDSAGTYRLVAGPAADGLTGLVDDDVTGCGNAVDTRSPLVRRLIHQCLLRWVEEIGVDGFRFDLAASLIRGDGDPTGTSAWLADLAGEPRLEGIKLVAEPWDLGAGGYALGRFPAPWREWNDRFRDDGRDLWRGEAGRSEAAGALTGTAGAFRSPTGCRDATTSVNALATHDGFTLADLVTYDEASDGHGQRSWNGGREGPTCDDEVRAQRRRRQRAMLATVLCAQGVPMVLAGDELGRTQAASANGYTLEPAEWGLPWADADWDLVAWVGAVVALRHREPALRRPNWVEPGSAAVTWRAEDGTELGDGDWNGGSREALQVDLDGTDLGGGRLLLLLTPVDRDVTFALAPGVWEVRLDAAWDRPPPLSRPPVTVSAELVVEQAGFVVLGAC